MNLLKRQIGRAYLRLTGWSISGEKPRLPKYVIIAAPHTSNWDLSFMLAIAWTLDLKISWMGKHTLFNPPFGSLMRSLGGVPVDRRSKNGIVQQMAEVFESRPNFVLGIPPEGTRNATPYWKSGFYQIAQSAQVPIVLGFLDYGQKQGGFGPIIMPNNDASEDMDIMRDFYGNKAGKYPEAFSAPRLRSETKES